MLQFDTQAALPWNTDGTLTVTSVRPNSSDDTESVTVYATYPGAVREAAASDGVFTYQDCKVTFASDAVTFNVKPADTLTFDGQTWKVKQATKYPFLKYWSVDCFRLVIETDKCDSVGVYRPTVTAVGAGDRSRSLVQVGSAVNGRLQSDGWGQEKEVDGRLVKRERYKCYLASPVTLLAGDILRVSGVDYEVTGSAGIDVLESFAYGTCERVT